MMLNQMNKELSDVITRRVTLMILVFVIVPIVLLVAFAEFRIREFKASVPYQSAGERDESRMELDVMPWRPVAGQRLYVPAYSHVYHQKGDPYLLTVTLNIRNTDLENEIVVTSVRYFDTGGNELRSLLKKPLRLSQLAATEFVIAREDKAGGSGASFIVEWQAGTEVSQPVVETVMVDTSSTQGIGFIASAVVLSENAK